MPETTPLIKAALNLRGGAGFDVYNIPLRDLFYIASEYQDLVDEKSLYSSGIQKIPTPSFLVFYNGTDRNVPAK